MLVCYALWPSPSPSPSISIKAKKDVWTVNRNSIFGNEGWMHGKIGRAVGHWSVASSCHLANLIYRPDADTRTEKMTNIKNDKLVHSLSGV